MYYDLILNPINNQFHKINSKKGKNILKQYLYQLAGAEPENTGSEAESENIGEWIIYEIRRGEVGKIISFNKEYLENWIKLPNNIISGYTYHEQPATYHKSESEFLENLTPEGTPINTVVICNNYEFDERNIIGYVLFEEESYKDEWLRAVNHNDDIYDYRDYGEVLS
tara:strand:- start:4 stop:507 length:504 start_codon:yes stop_codon:yes gene_type:complete